MLDKTYDAASVEPRIYENWEKADAFKAGANAKAGADPYCIVIPPPNVTGSLHMGHALNNTLQDILVRFERMRGRDVLWQVGTDHAGIATQMVVERQLAERGELSRRDMGRDGFLERVWQWKGESGGAIIGQLKRLGASCDWSRERFTMDEGLSAAVLRVFVALYNEGLIYKDKRLVNWDPHFETAISDLEVENIEVDGHFWHFKYPLANGETYEYVEKDEDGNEVLRETRDYISIATTRPETMLGDGAVAVHPSDERYRPIVGKMVHLPLCDRLIPIIVDDYPDPDFGSGAVKITGAHDFNDYQVARRNDIPLYSLMDEKAHLRADDSDDNLVPTKYRGMAREEARKAVVADIDAQGLMIRVEDKKIVQPFGDRSKVVIEPFLTDQWYVDAKTLAAPALSAVREGRTKFVPENWEKTYFQWLENIEPWCISRQLWWGHRIPAWYGPDGAIFVAESEADAQAAADAHYGAKAEIRRDEDVLDTWFSSALWPFSTLGWPEKTPELQKYYQTDVLVTGFDIIFFWVARMMMMGLHFMDKEPFHTVYIHALVRDEHGAKMSKSKGNVIDPLELVDEFSADALRFTLAAMAAQGRDIKLSKDRVAGYRNFTTKLWNAARFSEMNECRAVAGYEPASASLTLNRWIVTEFNKAALQVTKELEAYRFNEAAASAYRFVWNTFCDWHLELAKPVFGGSDEAAKAETRAATAYVLERTLVLLHPFIPFITEELWERTGAAGRAKGGFLIHAAWPEAGFCDETAAADINWLIDLVQAIRSVRAEMNVPAGAKTDLVLLNATEEDRERMERNGAALQRLARVEAMSAGTEAPKSSAQIVAGRLTACLPLEGVIDFDAERARLEKDRGKCSQEIEKIEKKLANEAFVAKAPEAVVGEQRARLADLREQMAKIDEGMARFG